MVAHFSQSLHPMPIDHVECVEIILTFESAFASFTRINIEQLALAPYGTQSLNHRDRKSVV